MSSPKEIAEKVIETQNRLDDIHSKLGIVSGYDEIVVIARAYLEFEKKHEYIHNKLLDDIEYQKSEITKLKEELNLGKSSLRCGQCGNIGMFHHGFAMADEIIKLKKSREWLRKACEDEKNIYPRFWSKVKVKRKNECWEWQSSISPQGYGKFSIDNYPYSAHVISYKYFNNDHDKNLVIDHICMNKKCVNPNHLRQVNYFISNTENTNGFAYINSKKKSCKNGHKFTNENTIIRKNKSGRAYRKCKKCRTIENKRAKAREAIKADDEIMGCGK